MTASDPTRQIPRPVPDPRLETILTPDNTRMIGAAMRAEAGRAGVRIMDTAGTTHHQTAALTLNWTPMNVWQAGLLLRDIDGLIAVLRAARDAVPGGKP